MKRSGTALSVLLCSLACWLSAVGSAKSDTADEQWCNSCWCCPASCPEHAEAAKADNVQEAALQDEATAGTSGEALCPAALSADAATVAAEEASPEILDEYDYENWYGHGYDYDDVAAAPISEATVTDVAEDSDADLNAEAATEAEVSATVEVAAEADADVVAEAEAVLTDSVSTPPADENELADENYFYEKYYQGRYADAARHGRDAEAEYEYFTGYGHDECWMASEETVAEPVQDEPQTQCETDVTAECDLANDEYESACSESYRDGYGYEYDSAVDGTEMPEETAAVEASEDGGFEYESEAEYQYDGTEYWNVSEPVETEAAADETMNWDAAANELEMLDDSELYGEESEYEACEQYGETESAAGWRLPTSLRGTTVPNPGPQRSRGSATPTRPRRR